MFLAARELSFLLQEIRKFASLPLFFALLNSSKAARSRTRDEMFDTLEKERISF
jgi:hypothetical protein